MIISEIASFFSIKIATAIFFITVINLLSL